MVEIDKSWNIDTLIWYFFKFEYLFLKNSKRSHIISLTSIDFKFREKKGHPML